MEIIEEGKRYLQHYLITRIFKLKAKEFMSLVSLVVSNDKSKNLMGERKIRKMVDEIIEDLRRRDFENEIEKYENDDDDFNSDDWDDFNIDDED
jgi:hypothetical protein